MQAGLWTFISAVRSGVLDEVKRTIKAEFLNAEGLLGMTALGEACRAGHIDIVRFLLDSGAEIRDEVHLACEYKGVEMVNAMVASGINVDIVDRFGKTPLHTAVERQDVETVEALLKHGAPVSKPGQQCRLTPLHIACEKDCIAIVNLLLAYGARTDVKDTSMRTPLHVAAWYCKSLEVLLTLLNHGALIDEVDTHGDTPLHIACDRGRLEVVRILLEHGASPTIMNNRHLSPLHFAFECDPILKILLDYGSGTEKCTQYACPCNATVIECEYKYRCGRFYPVDVIQKYFIKVDLAGVNYITKRDWEPVNTRNWGQQNRDLFSANCKAEIEKMKVRVIGDTGSTYYAVLCRRKSALLNKKIMNSALEALEEFPIYRHMIYCSFLKIHSYQRKQKLMDECTFFFELTNFSSMPLELVPLILEYLSEEELGHLIEICKTSTTEQRSVMSANNVFGNFFVT